jgi:hypothetical protein
MTAVPKKVKPIKRDPDQVKLIVRSSTIFSSTQAGIDDGYDTVAAVYDIAQPYVALPSFLISYTQVQVYNLVAGESFAT